MAAMEGKQYVQPTFDACYEGRVCCCPSQAMCLVWQGMSTTHTCTTWLSAQSHTSANTRSASYWDPKHTASPPHHTTPTPHAQCTNASPTPHPLTQHPCHIHTTSYHTTPHPCHTHTHTPCCMIPHHTPPHFSTLQHTHAIHTTYHITPTRNTSLALNGPGSLCQILRWPNRSEEGSNRFSKSIKVTQNVHTFLETHISSNIIYLFKL